MTFFSTLDQNERSKWTIGESPIIPLNWRGYGSEKETVASHFKSIKTKALM
jgi:hypothetical protein